MKEKKKPDAGCNLVSVFLYNFYMKMGWDKNVSFRLVLCQDSNIGGYGL